MWRLLLTAAVCLVPVSLVAAPIKFASVASVACCSVRLGDIADLASVSQALRTRAAMLSVASLPREASVVRLDGEAVASRARALMPALAQWLPRGGVGTIDVRLSRPAAKRAGPPPGCLQALSALAAGDVAAVGDFAPVACGGVGERKAFRYDASMGVARLDRDLRSGDVVSGVRQADLATVVPGEAIYLSARIGHVAVERRVEAVQAARDGRRLFVRADDGTVFSAPEPATP